MACFFYYIVYLHRVKLAVEVQVIMCLRERAMLFLLDFRWVLWHWVVDDIFILMYICICLINKFWFCADVFALQLKDGGRKCLDFWTVCLIACFTTSEAKKLIMYKILDVLKS